MNLTIQTDANNDMFIDGTGNIAMATGVLALQQTCEHAMKAQLGEMFLVPLQGLPTLSDVWRDQNFIKFEATARKTLTAIDGVIRVVSFTMSVSADVFTYVTQILTVYSLTLLTISDSIGKPL